MEEKEEEGMKGRCRNDAESVGGFGAGEKEKEEEELCRTGAAFANSHENKTTRTTNHRTEDGPKRKTTPMWPTTHSNHR